MRFVNDSKATNIEAARRAIESFDEGVVVILGGRFKGGDFRDLIEPLAARAHRRGDRRGTAEDDPSARSSSVVRRGSRHGRGRANGVRDGGAGRTVVLAPACASFDMFRDYAERGRVFKQEVVRLAEEWKGTREQ